MKTYGLLINQYNVGWKVATNPNGDVLFAEEPNLKLLIDLYYKLRIDKELDIIGGKIVLIEHSLP